MDTASIQEYAESARSIIDDSPQMQEATTKASLLNDFIKLLGWEIPMNTELEYSVKAFGKTHKVDYALLLSGQPSAFLEAKGLDTTLSSKHRNQLTDYLKGENVTWGILTNGLTYEFYQRRIVSETVAVERVEQTTIQQLPHKASIIEAYQAETIRNEEAGDIIEQIRKLRDSLDTLTNNKDELATAVVDVLSQSVSDVIEPQAQSQAKEMIDRLAVDIESEINVDVDVDTLEKATDEHPPSDPETNTPSVEKTYFVEISTGIDHTEIFESSVQSDLMTSVINYLVQNQGLISAIEPLPYIPGKKRAIINEKPAYNGKEMKQPRELEQEYSVETNLSWSQKQREMRRMAEVCDVEISIRETDV